jgi:two-component SAPR family response regulator
MRVMIVEDETLIAMLLEEILEDLGHTIVGIFGNLKDGLQAAATLDIDFASLDINLRCEQSYPIAKILQSRKIPFFFLTGYADISTFKFDNVPLLSKPTTIEQIKNIIDKMFSPVC